MPTDKKLIFALIVLAALGGAVFMQRQRQTADSASHSLEGEAKTLPKITFTDDDVKKVDKVVITRPSEKDSGAPETIELVKKGDEAWDLAEPLVAKGNANNVKSMIDDFKRLEVTELIDSSKDTYAKYKVTDEKALHVVAYKGKDVALDAYFGEDGSRGQMTRLAGKDGVYAVKGYSSYLFNKGAKDWRDKTIFKFEEKDVAKATLEDENGTFTFTKSGDDWKAEFAKDKEPPKDIERFDKSKADSFVRAFRTLSAADFGDKKTPAETGLATPKATFTFDMKDGSKYVLLAGDVDGSNRWAKKNGDEQIFSISSWAGDWATANVDKFQKADDKKDAKKDDKDKAGKDKAGKDKAK